MARSDGEFPLLLRRPSTVVFNQGWAVYELKRPPDCSDGTLGRGTLVANLCSCAVDQEGAKPAWVLGRDTLMGGALAENFRSCAEDHKKRLPGLPYAALPVRGEPSR